MRGDLKATAFLFATLLAKRVDWELHLPPLNCCHASGTGSRWSVIAGLVSAIPFLSLSACISVMPATSAG
jgi:hypothetical protein